MILSPDCLHAAQFSHTSGCAATPSNTIDYHDASQPLPVSHNFELNDSRVEFVSSPTSESLLLDGRLHSTNSQEPQEQKRVLISGPGKQRAPPPPPLKLKIPEHRHERSEWHIASQSPGLVDSVSATHFPSDYSGNGTGYFSPSQSPDPSPTTPVPPFQPSFVEKAHLRAPSIGNEDLPKLGAGKNRVLRKMVKERRSLQSLLMPSFLHSLQSQSTPLNGPPGSRTEVRSASTQNVSSSEVLSSDATSAGAGNDARSEPRRSFYGRRRSQTYSGRDNNITSPSLVSSVTRMPPMPEQYSPTSSGHPPAGRESPSSYLLDEDPFAVSPAMVVPLNNSPTYSPGYTPMHSPTHSFIHSPSTISLSSADSPSMPGTPIFHSFSLGGEEREDPASPSTVSTSTSPASPPRVPSPPPPTPSSPLNPNTTPGASLNERTKPREQMLRSISTTVSTTFTPPAPPSSASSSFSHASTLPQPPPTRARPAHTRPAFAPRPSLPSLSTLSRMGAVAGEFANSLRGRKRRGKVGASLPAEPWDLPTPEERIAEDQQEDSMQEDMAVENRNEQGSMGGTDECKKLVTEISNDPSASELSSRSELTPHVELAQEPFETSNYVPANEMDSAKEPLPPSDTNDVSPSDSQKIPVDVQVTDGGSGESRPIDLSPEKAEPKESESALEKTAGNEGGNGKVEGDAGNAHGEEGISIDAEHTYMTTPLPLSVAIEEMNGESVDVSAVVTTTSDDTPLSEVHEDERAERSADQDVDQACKEGGSLQAGFVGDGYDNDEDLRRLAASDAESETSLAKFSSCAVAIPSRTGAIPRHVLRALTAYPFSAPRCDSPPSSNASWSPQNSIEDFGVLLSSSPAFRGDQRPDSLTLDPGLPGAFVGVYACNQEFPTGEDQLSSKNGASSSSSASGEPLPSSVLCESVTEGLSETEADIEFRCVNDVAFAPEAEVTTESPAPICATSLCSTLPSQESSCLSFPIASRSEPDCPERSVSCSPFREGSLRSDSRTCSANRSSSRHIEDQPRYYLDDYDYGVEHGLYYDYTPEDEDDGSMLPPLSTPPEEDPVFTLSPSRSQERYEQAEYTSLASRSISKKASVATMASIFSMRSGSSGCTSQISHNFSRNHSPAASLSSTLPISSSQTGSLAGRRVYGPGPGLVDSTRGHAPNSSVSSLRSKSSVDLRSLANGRRQGSQSSGTSMLTHSSSRTKCDPHVELHGYKKSSAEDLSSGLCTYAGNPYVVAVQAGEEGKTSRYEKPNTARYEDDELVLDIQHEDVAPAVEAVISGWNAKAASVDAFEPGSSAGTLRPPTERQETIRFASRSPSFGRLGVGQSNVPASMVARGHVNGYDYSSGRGGAGNNWGETAGYGSGYGNGYYGQGNGSSGSDESGNHGGPPGTGRRGLGNDRDDDGDKYNRRPSAYSPTTSSTETETESESESDAELYGEQSPSLAQAASMQSSSVCKAPLRGQEEPEIPIFSQLRKGRKGVFRPPTTDNKGHARAPEDDDVPLAQRIPGALQAQKSIRQQVKSEHERRRRERSTAPSTRTSRAPEGTVSPPPQHVPGSGQNDRGRTLTARIPRSSPFGAVPMSSTQEAAMIAQRLMQPHHATHAVHRQRAKTLSGVDGVPPDVLTQRLLKVQAHGQNVQLPVQRGSAASAQPQTPALANVKTPADSASEMKGTGSQPRAPDTGGPARTLRPMRSLHGLSREPSSATPAATPPIPVVSAHRRSPPRARPATEADAASGGLMRNRSLKGTRTITDKSARRSEEEAHILPAQHPHSQTYAVPPVPVLSRGPSPPAHVTRHTMTQMRIFISDMQHFNVVGAGLDTSAKDVLDMLRQQGDLRGEERSSISWMLYEICQDFGMERPVRTFELVADISGSWNKEAAVNCFMVKPSRFAQQLATIPSSIPTRSGFVDYESKKGKWNKRWLELREHGLWLSKREGKDDEFLCSLSAFDAYIVTRIHKAPRGFTFAVKSTDPITLFENKADYLHVFSVPEETGLAWVEAIWLARSYILYQEKNVLFRNKSAGEKSTAGTGSNLARSGTRKKPAQTYVSIESSGPFEPGSLLAKRTAVA